MKKKPKAVVCRGTFPNRLQFIGIVEMRVGAGHSRRPGLPNGLFFKPSFAKCFLGLRGSVLPFTLRFFLKTGCNTTTIARHHGHHYPTLSQEHLSLSLKSNLSTCIPSSALCTYFILDPKYLGLRLGRSGTPDRLWGGSKGWQMIYF
jgi:hypothetical protein